MINLISQEVAIDTTGNTYSSTFAKNEITISVYPVPAERFIYLNFDAIPEGTINVSVFNIMGVLKKSITKNVLESPILSIDLAGLKKGLYFLIIKTKSSKTTRRISLI